MRAGIDIGGTHIKGILLEGSTIVWRDILKTKDGADWKGEVKRMWEKVKEVSPTPLKVLGLSAPGIASADHRSIAHLPNRLEGLEDFVWSDYLQVETTVLNDAQAALWAEVKMGLAVNHQHVLLITLGTGVGGGLLINGQIHEGFLQRGGHVGHVCIDVNGERTSIAGMPGSLEDAIGEASLGTRSFGRYQKTKDLVNSYQQGDTWATHIWLESVRKLALAIASFSNSFSPEIVLLAGGITKAGGALLSPLHDFLAMYEWRPKGIATPIVIAKYEEFAGALGAALYVQQ